MLYLAFQAFDTVPHDKLLFMLKTLGVSGKVWLWLKAYLIKWKNAVYVSIDENRASLLPVVSGVP